MATKKAPAKKVEVAPQEEKVVTTTSIKKEIKPEWETKDRIYYLKGDKGWKTKRNKICYKPIFSTSR